MYGNRASSCELLTAVKSRLMSPRLRTSRTAGRASAQRRRRCERVNKARSLHSCLRRRVFTLRFAISPRRLLAKFFCFFGIYSSVRGKKFKSDFGRRCVSNATSRKAVRCRRRRDFGSPMTKVSSSRARAFVALYIKHYRCGFAHEMPNYLVLKTR